MVKKFPNPEGLLCAIAVSICYVVMFRGSVYNTLDLLLFVVGFLGLFFISFMVVSYVACMDSLEVKEVGCSTEA